MLAVPLLVAIGLPFLQASTMSLVVVGTGAAAALVPHHRARRVDWPVGLTFGALGSVGSVVGAWMAGLLPTAVLLGGLAALLVAGSSAMLSSGLRARAAARSAYAEAAEAPAATDADPAPAAAPQHSAPTEDPEHLLLDSPELTERSIALATRDEAAASTTRITPRVVGLASAVGVVTGLFGVGAGLRRRPRPGRRDAAAREARHGHGPRRHRHEQRGGPRRAARVAHRPARHGRAGARSPRSSRSSGRCVSRRIPGWILSTTFGALLALVAVYTLVQGRRRGLTPLAEYTPGGIWLDLSTAPTGRTPT